jgi:AraC-like DNA-binding protein
MAISSSGLATIEVSATTGLMEHLLSRSVDPLRALKAVGLAPSDLRSPDGRIPLCSFVELLEVASGLADDEFLGAHFAPACPLEAMGRLGRLAADAPTLGESLTAVTRHYRLLADATDVGFETTGSVARFWYRLSDAQIARRKQDAEGLLAIVLIWLRDNAGADFRPQAVCFEHAAPNRADELARIFGCPLRFGCRTNALLFARDVTRRPLQARRPARAEPLRLADRTYAAMLRGGGEGLMDVQAISRTLGLGGRTLQRRLREEGVTYRQLLDRARLHLARHLLDDPSISSSELAAQLGYSDAVAFYHAYRRWTGSPPQRERRRRSTFRLR